MEMDARVFYIKQKMRGREKDSEETEIESVLETENCWKRGIGLTIKETIIENMWCKCKINQRGDQDAANDVVPTISVFSTVSLPMTFRSDDKSQAPHIM